MCGKGCYVNGCVRGCWSELTHTVTAQSDYIQILLQAESPQSLNSNIYFDELSIQVGNQNDCSVSVRWGFPILARFCLRSTSCRSPEIRLQIRTIVKPCHIPLTKVSIPTTTAGAQPLIHLQNWNKNAHDNDTIIGSKALCVSTHFFRNFLWHVFLTMFYQYNMQKTVAI